MGSGWANGQKEGKCGSTHYRSRARHKSRSSSMVPVVLVVDSGGQKGMARREYGGMAVVVWNMPVPVVIMMMPVMPMMVLQRVILVRADGRSSIVMRRVVRLCWTVSRAAVAILRSLADPNLLLGAVAETHVGCRNSGTGRLDWRTFWNGRRIAELNEDEGQASGPVTYDVRKRTGTELNKKLST